MIITCPHCSARYRVKDDMIPAKGKRIRCKKCSAVFVAYPDKPEVLERKPEAATVEQKPVKPEPEPTTAPAGATVKVDRSRLDQFLKEKQSAPAATPPPADQPSAASTVKIESDQYKQFLQQQASQDVQAGATVQVDRSQINAFLQSQGDGAEDGATVQMDNGATVQMSNDALSGLVENTAPTAPSISPPLDGATIKMDSNALSGALEQAAADNPDPTATKAMPTMQPQAPSQPTSPPSEGIPNLSNETPADEPAFPSDEELGINQDDSFSDTSQETPPAPQTNELPPFPSASEPEQQDQEVAYTALVEGSTYPNLKIDSIERWIREGRLLADDQLAVGDSQDFHPANSFADIAEIFARYDSQFSPPSKEEQPAKKKGFFAKLFGLGK